MMGGAEEEPEFRRRIVKSASAATAIVTAPSIIFAVTNGSMETIYEVIYLVLFLEVLVLSLSFHARETRRPTSFSMSPSS